MSTESFGAGTKSAADYRLARERLWGAVVDRDEFAAAATVFAALDQGAAPEDVLLEVIAPVQRKVGAEWAANRINVAAEHAATAINDRVIAALAHHPASKPVVSAGRVTVACVDGEWHALPARLLAEVLRLRGFQVDFLGAQVPTPHLIAHLHAHGPDAVALSCSIPTQLPTAHAAITASQAAGATVLAGGAAFGPDGRYAYQLGAQAWAPDARAAAERLRKGFPSVHAASTHQPIDDLPHLADQEYTMVSRSATQLVRGTVVQLADRWPGMRAYDDVQRQRTTEDIAHIVDYLATALYVDDDDLFTNFITWTADILEARGVPAASLYPALDLLGDQLTDFPRSQRLLHAAHGALAARSRPTIDPTAIA
ncbi:cobalamin-binding protein [Mycolicibacterium moriokaense]|nr:cobalamin-binding protein [Mycolicibacterium moriokaense]